MTIQRLYRNRLVISAILGSAALAMAATGVFLDRIFFLPAAMMATSAGICFYLAWSSHRFDLGKSGPAEYRQLVGEARAWAENGDRAAEEAKTGAALDDKSSETR